MKGSKTVLSLMQLPVTNYSHNESVASSNKSDNNSESDGYHSESESTDEQKYTNPIYSNSYELLNFLSIPYFQTYRNLIEEYNRMYKCLRLETLKSLSDTNNFHIAESVKLKILFSIVVVSMKKQFINSFSR
jgi:hypothetical protein